MAKKMIAVVPLWDDEKESIWMLPNYLDGIRESGGIPVILPLHSRPEDALQILELCQGLLMTGGHDVDPAMYGQEKKPTCGKLCPARDALEQALYRRAVTDNKAVLGICRGLQSINVLEGGTLYQDLPTEAPGQVEHHAQPPYDQVAHTVRLESGLKELLGLEELGVNSYHHQGIDRLGPELESMAFSEDGLIEAIRHKKKRFVWATQWHPEFRFWVDENSRKIFQAFLDAC